MVLKVTFGEVIHLPPPDFLFSIGCPFKPVGIPVFGPSALAARMEGSKAFAKAFMARHSIPTAEFRVFSSSEIDQAIRYVQTCQHPVVLKASGLAAGKGVLIPESVEEALNNLQEILVANVFGDAGVIASTYLACLRTLEILSQETKL
jgi:phosphoribosylamine--glycine ligase/phosphoribosylformylglycinamidine cyclo-ligase